MCSSDLGEFVFDHPFLWGSKRTGPDLHRVGGKYPDAWHYNHLDDPRSTSPGSIMPRYSWLLTQKLDKTAVVPRMKALRKVGVPYTDEDVAGAADAVKGKSEQEALIAYLQGLGLVLKNVR